MHLHLRFRRIVALVAGLLLTLSIHAQVITKSFRGVPLKTVLEEVEKQTGYSFLFESKEVDVDKPVTASFKNATIQTVLDKVLDGSLRYTINDKLVTISQRPRQGATVAKDGSVTLSGTVISSSDNQPIVGANVYVEGTTLGVTTDIDGNYSLTVPASTRQVTFSFLGYDMKKIAVKDSELFKLVTLVDASNELEDVVVVGFGVQKKESLVGAVQSVKPSELQVSSSNLSTSFAGKIAGVIAVQKTGEPGADGANFWIRGISTFGSSTTPLVLVDGIERDLDLVDIEDIKDFSILKDAAATAIYGVRGANGVVLVTTRGGIVGKPQINIKFEAGMVQPTKIPDMIDAVQFAEMYNAAAGYDFYSKKDIQMFRDGSDPDLHPNIDWVDRLYKDYSFNQRVNVNISGGGSTAKYYISGGFYNEDGLFKADNMKEYNTSVFYRRFNVRSNVEVQLHKYTKLNVNLATTFERKNEPGSSATGANGIWGYALKTAANAFPDVYSNGYLAGPASGQGENPYALLTQTGYREIFYNTAQSLFVLTQDLGDWVTKGLTVSIKGSFDAKNENNLSRTKTSPQWLATGRNEAGELEFNQTKIGEENLTYKQTNKGYRSVYFEAVANWARTFGKHDLSALFLYQQSQRNDVGIDKSQPELALPYRHQGIAGRITYSYDNRYFIEGNFGYNAQTGEYGDMVAMGVLDPTKVTRTALQNAASVAGLILTTDCMVADIPEDKPAVPPMGGMGGMDGMM